MGGAVAIRNSLYNAFMRRTSVYVTVCVAAAYASTEAYFAGTDRLWNSINKGVRLVLLRRRANLDNRGETLRVFSLESEDLKYCLDCGLLTIQGWIDRSLVEC